ncbi:hypothetical protein [Microtetraspora glauca]|uniref:Alcohol dehydrogenase N-terminal domain-containing protein n=1 Tax=Microtetraspora glauca TaxID=1996 RepID=A0ABV3GEE1_MICGL
MRELVFLRSGTLSWRERDAPVLTGPGDAIVRPFLAGRCDGDILPLHRPVSRALQAGMRLGLVDPVVRSICGDVPFRGPFTIGHECVADIGWDGDDAALPPTHRLPRRTRHHPARRLGRRPAAYTAKTTKLVLRRDPERTITR